MFGKPVINVGFNPPSVPEAQVSYARYYEFDHYKPVIESGAICLARSLQELREMILECLRNPAARTHERRVLISEMFGDTLDGGSSTREADTLLRLASLKSYA